ncbi:hypothetical protein BDW02DRAFT_424962 [Decorospora gaudefroyi]|uniref:Uncharacterized protein n=1 Tax=Decorospora gaudefroyi TaxID=184978 RepID=A0A6A5K5J7_9PLEO|nr:hypothetical protein BDW02DRAFT_424962 [Decorospora gaudefroyi]
MSSAQTRTYAWGRGVTRDQTTPWLCNFSNNWAVTPGLRSGRPCSVHEIEAGLPLVRPNTAPPIPLQSPIDHCRDENMELPVPAFDLTARPLEMPFDDRPPPPPPPPPPALAQPDELYASESPQHAHHDDIERRRWSIRDAREDLMGSRVKLQSDRKIIRVIRQETGSKEGAALSKLKLFLHEQSIVLPREIEDQLEEIDELRDRLGSQEADYDEAEQSYNLKEINYTQKEAQFVDFVDSFLDGNGQQSPMLREDTQPTGVDDLMRFPFGTSDDWTQNQTVDINEVSPSPPETSKTPEQNYQSTPHFEPEVGHMLSVRGSRTGLAPHHGEEDISERNQLKWFETKKRINEWLLDMVSHSAIQRTHLRSLDNLGSTENESWWQKVADHWHLISYAGTQFHTGDSTISDGEFSNQNFVSEPDMLGGRPIDAHAPRPNALFSAEQNLDALNDSENPPSIRSFDLQEAKSTCDVSPVQQKREATGTADFLSAEPPTTNQSGSHEDFASIITVEKPCSCGNSQVGHRHHSSKRLDLASSLQPLDVTAARIPLPLSPSRSILDPGEELPHPRTESPPIISKITPPSAHQLEHFLRLTPLTGPEPISITSLPFVAFSNSILRLPGPTSYSLGYF